MYARLSSIFDLELTINSNLESIGSRYFLTVHVGMGYILVSLHDGGELIKEIRFTGIFRNYNVYKVLSNIISYVFSYNDVVIEHVLKSYMSSCIIRYNKP